MEVDGWDHLTDLTNLPVSRSATKKTHRNFCHLMYIPSHMFSIETWFEIHFVYEVPPTPEEKKSLCGFGQSLSGVQRGTRCLQNDISSVAKNDKIDLP